MASWYTRIKYRGIRQCELDFRVLPRDMMRQRILHKEIVRLVAHQKIGRSINEAELARLRIQKKHVDDAIPERFDRLYANMGRIFEDQQKWAELIGAGGVHGYRPHP